MTNSFPTRFEMKCSGCSFVIAHVLLMIAIFLFSIDYDFYAVQSEEQVTTLHNILSSQTHRTEVEIAVSAIWLAYPFLLLGLFGIKKILTAVYAETGGEMLIFAAVQSYIVFITIACVIVPAISLTTSAFEWSFHEYTPEIDFIPTGYYIQLYLVIFNAEILDCIAVADAVFMISLFILPRFIIGNNATFKKIKSVMDPDLPNCLKNMQCLIKCYNIMMIAFVLSLFVVFCIVLFEFAESGFFSPTGKAKFLVIWAVVLKLIMGIKIAVLGCSKKYDAIKRIFVDEGKMMLADDIGERYKMDKIGVETDDKKENLDDDDDAL